MEKRTNRLRIEKYATVNIVCDSSFVEDTTILYCTKGRATIELNGSYHAFEKNTNFIIIEPVHFAFVECSEDFCYTEITFGAKSFNRIYTRIDTSILNRLKSSTPDIASATGFVHSNLTLDKIILLNDSDSEHRDMIMRNLIFCYIYECYDILKDSIEGRSEDNSNVVSNLVSRFLILCREHHKEHRDIDYYADSLAISRRYLHTVVMSKLHATPKQIIDGFVLSSAKRLLLTTTMSALQIADELNFPDQSTFGQFVRRLVGVSLSEFRKQMRKES